MIAQELQVRGVKGPTVTVSISNEVVHLLSDQLYQSPLKAIEELVVNSYDADAGACRVFVPSSTEMALAGGRHFVSVFDTGSGLTKEGMVDLWHVGRSNKRSEEIKKRSGRKQIGKFGIGKLATYTIAKKLTYISKTQDGILSASLDFSSFGPDPSGSGKPVEIEVRLLTDWTEVRKTKEVQGLIEACGATDSELNGSSWTIAVLEELKPKAHEIRLGMLRWVLSTAMPLKVDFQLFLNSEQVESSKLGYNLATEFDLKDLSASRLKALSSATGDNWHITKKGITTDSFPEGITGSVIVTERTLPGKSDDLLRSYGFFVKVRGRLIYEDEPFFGMTHLHHGTLNRFRADIQADDLDDIITAPRENVGATPLRDKFEALLVEVFQEARQRYERFLSDQEKEEKNKKEHSRVFLSPSLVEQPIASAISNTQGASGADADATWFYFDLPPQDEIAALTSKLYSGPRTNFAYQYSGLGKQSRLVRFDPATSTFTINLDHPFVAAHATDPHAKLVLEDFVTAEAMLEAQLRLARIHPPLIGEVLEERDKLLRSLALDHPYSSTAIAKALRDAANDEHDLELALVAAARSLGFVAKHISGAGEPDGVARFLAYPEVTTLLTLEAKSSKEVPSLSAIDFAGLHEHRETHGANGCLLVAPAYPGSGAADSAAANRAKSLRISCWTIEQLARAVESAEVRHITAKQIIEIVLSRFAPDDVAKAVDGLFAAPTWDQQKLNNGIIEALRTLAGKLPDTPRNVLSIATVIANRPGFEGIKTDDVRKAISQLAAISQGALVFDGETLTVFTSYEELTRRAASLTGVSGKPLRLSKFRNDMSGDAEPEEH
jgi:hypothetical protein